MIYLRLFFHGLIAFAIAPHQSQITALLVASHDDQSRCIAKHSGTLVFPTTDQTNCRNAKCDWNANLCTCTLDADAHHQTITIGATANPEVTDPDHEPPSSALPATSTDAADVAYLMNMSNLGSEVMQTALTGNPGNLVARMVSPYTRLTACDLATDPDTDDVLHSNNFHSFGSAKRGWDQAIAQGLAAEADVPPGNVTLTLGPFESGGGTSYTLALLPGTCSDGTTNCIEVYLEYTRPPFADLTDDCNKAGVGRDFAFYFDLATLSPPFDNRLVPQVDADPSTPVKVAKIQPAICPKRHTYTPQISHGRTGATTQSSHPACAMAVFYDFQ